MSFNFKILLFDDKQHIAYIIEHDDDNYYDDDEMFRSIIVIKNKDDFVYSKLYKRWKKNVRFDIKNLFGNFERIDAEPQEVYDIISTFCDNINEGDINGKNYHIPKKEIALIEDILNNTCIFNQDVIDY
jgi:hypothetical protein